MVLPPSPSHCLWHGVVMWAGVVGLGTCSCSMPACWLPTLSLYARAYTGRDRRDHASMVCVWWCSSSSRQVPKHFSDIISFHIHQEYQYQCPPFIIRPRHLPTLTLLIPSLPSATACRPPLWLLVTTPALVFSLYKTLLNFCTLPTTHTSPWRRRRRQTFSDLRGRHILDGDKTGKHACWRLVYGILHLNCILV